MLACLITFEPLIMLWLMAVIQKKVNAKSFCSNPLIKDETPCFNHSL